MTLSFLALEKFKYSVLWHVSQITVFLACITVYWARTEFSAQSFLFCFLYLFIYSVIQLSYLTWIKVCLFSTQNAQNFDNPQKFNSWNSLELSGNAIR